MLTIERPTDQDIFAMRDDRRSFYAVLHREMAIDEDYFRWSSTQDGRAIAARYMTNFPKDFVPKVLPLARMGIESGLNSIIVGDTPLVDVDLPVGSHRDEALEQAHEEEIENWCQAWMHRVDTGSMESLFRDLLTKMLVCGMGVLYYPPQWDVYPKKPEHGRRTKTQREAWAKYERERAACFPWAGIRSVHPRNCLPDPDHDPPEDLIIEEDVSLGAMLQAYPHLREHDKFRNRVDYRAGGVERTSKRLIYCSANFVATYIDDVPVLDTSDGADEYGVAENPTKRPWFRVAAGGFGDADALGKPEHKFKGRIRDTRDVIIRLMTDINIIEQIRMVAAFPPLLVQGQLPDASDADKVAAQYTYGAGAIQAIPPGITFLSPPIHQVPPDVFRDLQESKQQFQLCYGVDPLTGQYRDEPASALRTRLQQARAPYRTPKKNAEQAVAAMLEDILVGQLPEMDGPVLVQSLKLTRPVPEGVMLTVNFSLPTEDEQAARRAEGAQLLEMGVSRRHVFSEYLDIDDPNAEIVERKAEDIVEQAPLIEAITRVVIGEFSQFLQAKHPHLAAALGQEQTMPQAGNGQQVAPAAPDPSGALGYVPAPGAGVQLPGEQPPPAVVAGAAELQ